MVHLKRPYRIDRLAPGLTRKYKTSLKTYQVQTPSHTISDEEKRFITLTPKTNNIILFCVIYFLGTKLECLYLLSAKSYKELNNGEVKRTLVSWLFFNYNNPLHPSI